VMTFIKVKGFQIFKDRHGTPRCYHRKSGTAIDLAKCPIGSLEFFAECQRVAALGKAIEPKPGTLSMLISKYRDHPKFQDLAPRTRSDYQNCFDYLKPIGDTPLMRFTPSLVVNIRDKAVQTRGRRQGNYVRTVMALVFAWGLERGFLLVNPALHIKSIKRPKGTPQANRPWSDVEREIVMTSLPAHMKLPIALMMYCGLDPQDSVKLKRSAVKDGKLDTKRGKTDVAVWFDLPADVVAAISEAPAHDAISICANSRGLPWTISGFQSSWAKYKSKLEREGLIAHGLTLKGLRHTVGTILAEMGYDPQSIADLLGHETSQMAHHYSKRANRTKKVNAIIKDFDAELNRRRTKVVKPN
jgi:integrase